MKKFILLSLFCCFLSQVTLAQFSSLEEFFKHYSEKDGFTYIYHGRAEASDYRCLPHDVSRYYEPEGVQSMKVLGYEKPINDLSSNVITNNLKELLRQLNFELIKKLSCNNSNTEIYQKINENNNLITVKILIYGARKQTYIRWVSGTAKP